MTVVCWLNDTHHITEAAVLLLPLQVDADSSVLRGKLGEMLNAVLGRQAHKAELAAWFSVSWQPGGGGVDAASKS
jgi:hypothetical protein